MLITLKQYAAINGRALSTVQQAARNGSFQTAIKPGHEWLIDDQEPYPTDKRIKSGKYVRRSSRAHAM